MISNSGNKFRFLSSSNQQNEINSNPASAYDSNSLYNYHQNGYYSYSSAQSSSPENSYELIDGIRFKSVNNSLADESYYSLSNNTSYDCLSSQYRYTNYSPYYYNYLPFNYSYIQNSSPENNYYQQTISNNYESTPESNDNYYNLSMKTNDSNKSPSKENVIPYENQHSTPNQSNKEDKKSKKSRNIMTQIGNFIYKY
jgi:hypothetical protein